MVSVTTIMGDKVQKYYLLFGNHTTGFYPVWGPYYYDFANSRPAQRVTSLNINMGKPIETYCYDNMVDALVHPRNTIHDEHGCTHSNIKGNLTYFDYNTHDERFDLAIGTDSTSQKGQFSWFFGSTNTARNRSWNLDSYIGYEKGSIVKVKNTRIPLSRTSILIAPGQVGMTTWANQSHDYVNCTNLPGEFHDLCRGRFTYDTIIRITKFTYPNIVDMELWINGVLNQTSLNYPLTIVPVTPAAPMFVPNQKLLRDLITSPIRYLSHADTADGSLAQEAVASLNYINCNMLENMADWKEVKKTLPPIKDLRLRPKNLANLYLWYKYSLRPNLTDVPEAFKGLAQFYTEKGPLAYERKYATKYANGKTKYGLTLTRSNIRVKVRPKNYGGMRDIYFKLKSLGLSPTPENIWDLIPFSFVVDWFLPVGDFLSSSTYSFEVAMNMYDVYDVVTSHRTTQTLDARVLEPSLTGILTYTIYDRKVTKELPTNSFEFGSKDPLKHIFEGSALVVANW